MKTFIKWCKVDNSAQNNFWKTYREGLWNQGGLGQFFCILSGVLYSVIFALGAMALWQKSFEGAFNIAEKIERLRERKDKDLLSMKDDIERE